MVPGAHGRRCVEEGLQGPAMPGRPNGGTLPALALPQLGEEEAEGLSGRGLVLPPCSCGGPGLHLRTAAPTCLPFTGTGMAGGRPAPLAGGAFWRQSQEREKRKKKKRETTFFFFTWLFRASCTLQRRKEDRHTICLPWPSLLNAIHENKASITAIENSQ